MVGKFSSSCAQGASYLLREDIMKRLLAGLALIVLAVGAAWAQTPNPNPAINTPDEFSWQLFAIVNKSVPSLGNNVVFETWASNEDTFQTNPVFPGTNAPRACAPAGVFVANAAPQPVTPVASPKILNVPALIALAPSGPGPRPLVTPGGSEEVRRNQATFNFIYCNKLYSRAGLRVAFASGQPISFPLDSIEVKANWVPVGNRSADEFHINTASDGKRYALVSMHIISKTIPNWTWATFEHESNLGRCDFIGCHDNFGAIVKDVPPYPISGGAYSPCAKTEALKSLFAGADLPAFWQHYCLKGSQVDFVTATGIPTLLGNSVTEAGFVNTSSCITCHSRAAFEATGKGTTSAGFLSSPIPAVCPTGDPCSPNGAPNSSWFWNNPGQPNQLRTALQADFIWSIPRHAVGP
jgi:hypothetical protein